MKSTSKSLIEKEIAKRTVKSAPLFLDGNFPIQEDFIRHESRMKALFCTRRFGKSYTGALYACKEAYENPGCKVLLIGLTRDSTKGIFWQDILKQINKRFKLNMRFNLTELTASLPNGSVIRLLGVDSSEEDKDKILGQKYRLAVIDEAASYTIDLRHLVYGILKPAMADLNGTIVMLGTPGNLTKSLFFDVTTGIEPGWHVIKATTFDNPYMAEKWRLEIEELKAKQPYIVETPLFKQFFLGEWVIDSDALVYKFNSDRNLYENLPMHKSGEWQYVLGVDLGYEDASAFVVVAFHEHSKVLYVVDTFAQKHMDITDVANAIKGYRTKYNISKIVVDNANKQAVEEIQKRHQLSLTPADKTGKSDFIEIMNSELICGNIKLHSKAAWALAQEWQNLIWKEKGTKREENPSCDNHLSDACLYAWRFCYNYLGQRPSKPILPGTQEYYDAEVERMESEAEEYFKKLEEGEKDPYGW